MIQPVYIGVARSFAHQKGVSENKVQPLAEIIERWHREFPIFAVMGKLSPEALALGPAIRKPARRRQRERIHREERSVRKRIRQYVESESRYLNHGDQEAVGLTIGPLTWFSILLWAWRNRKLIVALISFIREQLAYDRYKRERVLS